VQVTYERVDLGPNVTLFRGDCLEVMADMQAGCVDAVITDPPYLVKAANVPIRGRGVTARIEDSFSIGLEWGYSLEWMDTVAALKPEQWIVFGNFYMLGGLCHRIGQFAEVGSVFVWRKNNAPRMTRNVPRFDCEFIVWAKGEGATNQRARNFDSQVLDVPMPQAGCFATERFLVHHSGKAAHPTQKPIAIVKPFVENLTAFSMTVFDPFMGSGTTGVAAVQTGRRFVGVEIDKGYFDIAVRRITDALAQPHLIPPAMLQPTQAHLLEAAL
jgi:DNA modification methylase